MILVAIMVATPELKQMHLALRTIAVAIVMTILNLKP